MKLTKTLIKKIIKEEFENLTTEEEEEEVTEQPRGPYSEMTDKELLWYIHNPPHFKNYFSALKILKTRPGFEDLIAQGKIPKLSSSGNR